jgi:predicted ATP-grasp superfamily ATP-dependent carboligase
MSVDRLRRPSIQKRMAATAPAVVLPVAGGTGLGVVRNLGRLGVPVIAMDSDPAAAGLASRYAIPLICSDPRNDGDEALLQDLERVGAALPQRAVLFPAFDDHVCLFSRHKERLERYYRIPQSGWEVMSEIEDKECQLKAAARLGVDLPLTAFVHGPEDLPAAAAGMRFPALFKPIRPQEMRRRFGVKVITMAGADELPAAYAQAQVCGPLLLQEIVPGGDDAFFTCGTYLDAASRPLGVFVSRKVRQHPPRFGEARIAVSQWDEVVVETTLRLLTGMGFHGVSGTEFKLDPRDGRLKLMEVNARHWLHHPLAVAVGINLSQIAYLDALGRPMMAGRQEDGVRWLDLNHELRDSFGELLHGQLNPADFCAGFHHARLDAFFSLDDPGPPLHQLTEGIRRRIQHLFGSR